MRQGPRLATAHVHCGPCCCGLVHDVFAGRAAHRPRLYRATTGDASHKLIPGMDGQTCTELDLLEGNANALQSAIHTEAAGEGDYGSGKCDRDGCFSRVDRALYGQGGSVIDTRSAFEVRALVSEEGELTVSLTQAGQQIISFDKNMGGNPQGSGGGLARSTRTRRRVRRHLANCASRFPTCVSAVQRARCHSELQWPAGNGGLVVENNRLVAGWQKMQL